MILPKKIVTKLLKLKKFNFSKFILFVLLYCNYKEKLIYIIKY